MPQAGRPERPLDTSAGPLPRLAGELRRLRTGHTYRELADATGLSVATLRAAAAGERVPSWRVTRAFAAACDGGESTVRELWERAWAAAGRPIPDDYPSAEPPVPGSGEVTSAAQLVSMMRRLRVWAGNPSLANLNDRVSGHNQLPPSTVSDMLRRQRLPRLELMSDFVRACGLDDGQVTAWEQAWTELRKQELREQELQEELRKRKDELRQRELELRDHEPDLPQPLARARLHEPAYGSRAWAAVTDFCCAAAAVTVALELRFDGYFTREYAVLSLILPLLWVATLFLCGGYNVRFIGAGSDEFRRVLNASVSLTAALAIFSYAVSTELSRGFLVIAMPGVTLLGVMARYVRRKRLHKQRAAGRRLLSVVAVGHEPAVADLIGELRRDIYHGLSVVAACVTGSSGAQEVAGVPVFGGLDDVTAAVRRLAADTVVVLSCPEMTGVRLRSLAWELEKTGTELCVAPALLDVTGPRTTVRPAAGLTLLHVDHPELGGGQRVMKGLFDRLTAGAALILLAPLMLALAAAIRLSDRGPALFTQTRVGKDGRLFKIYKFRTMVPNAERHIANLRAKDNLDGILFKLRRDPRITPIGAWMRRWSLDELPELVNVFLGDMSLVGPPPALPEEAEKYADHVRRRLAVKPGLTGLWQVTGRSDLSWEESVRLDLRYVENWSLALDLQIMWKTIAAFLRGSGAY